jgi:hypothetical protein
MRTLVICAIVAIAGCASTPAPNQTAQTAVKSLCVGSASRIPQSDKDCIAPGSSYTQQDINRTGRQNPEVADALQMLDPALQVHH